MADPKSPLHAEFGRRARERRHVLEMTIEQVAEVSGLHWSYIAQVERGERNISLTNIIRLADAIDVDPGFLVEGLTTT